MNWILHCDWLLERFFFFFCVFMDLSTLSWSINMKKKNLAKMQPSWPHAWSITQISSIPKCCCRAVLITCKRMATQWETLVMISTCANKVPFNNRSEIIIITKYGLWLAIWAPNHVEVCHKGCWRVTSMKFAFPYFILNRWRKIIKRSPAWSASMFILRVKDPYLGIFFMTYMHRYIIMVLSIACFISWVKESHEVWGLSLLLKKKFKARDSFSKGWCLHV